MSSKLTGAQFFNQPTSKKVMVFPPFEDKIFSPYILRNGTHFVTTRETMTLRALDCLWDTQVKIVSALDDGIFDGEPLVDC